MDSNNVVNWIQKTLLHCALLLIVIAVQQKVGSCNVVNWIQKILFHFSLLLIVSITRCVLARPRA